MTSAQHFLDQIHSLAGIAALEAEPAAYAERLAAELPTAATLAELEARDAVLVRALGQIDAMIARAMRIRLDHALAADTSIGAPTRSVFASTITGYAGRLPLLAQRARDVAARGRAADPDHVADAVIDVAGSVLALRDAVRAGVLAVIRELAQAAVPEADRRARDRNLDDPHGGAGARLAAISRRSRPSPSVSSRHRWPRGSARCPTSSTSPPRVARSRSRTCSSSIDALRDDRVRRAASGRDAR